MGRVRVFLALALLTFLFGCGEGPAQTPVSLRLTSAEPPQGVSVRLFGPAGRELEATTPCEVSLPPGRYRYAASAPGYRLTTGEVVIAPGASPHLDIPPLTPAAGPIQVRANAQTAVFVDGTAAGTAGPDPARWTSFGPYPEGPHAVRGETPLGAQEVTATVYAGGGALVEFLWGSRLQVAVEPAGIPSTTIRVDGRPYTCPVDFDAGRLSSRPFAQVEVSAPGYVGWAGRVDLRAGQVVTASAVLTPTRPPEPPVEEKVLSDYWNFWAVWKKAGETLDTSLLPQALAGRFLERETEMMSFLRKQGTLKAFYPEPGPHEPAVLLVGDGKARVHATCVLTQTAVEAGGVVHKDRYRLDGELLMERGEDEVWRAYDWEGVWEKVVPPTPVPPPGGGGGGGWTKPPLPDREKIIGIILARVNCIRAEHGLPPVEYDREVAQVLQPFADYATRYAVERHWLGGLPNHTAEIQAALAPYGAKVFEESGLSLSFVPGRTELGLFAFDWENYDGDPHSPCEIDWGDWMIESWLAPMTRLAVVLGPPDWFYPCWQTVAIFARR